MLYKINELAKVLGVTTNTLRRYENNGYVKPERDESDYRKYNGDDISKIALVRLYRKCGFTHEELMGMLNSGNDKIEEICDKHLKKLDEEMARLKFLRHWLKDRLALMRNMDKIGDGSMVMEQTGFKYVLYSNGDKLLTEKKRLKTINCLLNTVEEAKQIRICRLEDAKAGNIILNKGLEIHEYDIDRLNLHEIMDNNEFVEDYPAGKCLYYVISFDNHIPTAEEKAESLLKIKDKCAEFMRQNNYKPRGDIMTIPIGILGNSPRSLVCIPIEDKN